jgi:hypothetical protein
MGSVRTTDPGWLAATTPVPSPKRRRRVSARLFGRSSIEVARGARFPTLIRHEVRLPHLAHSGHLFVNGGNGAGINITDAADASVAKMLAGIV